MAWLQTLRSRARALKTETLALYLAARDPRTPWVARLIVAVVVAYALSPIDLIPDWIPVLGYLDDLILVPLGIALAIRLIPPPVLAECREKARARVRVATRSGCVIAAIVAVWIALAALTGWVLWRFVAGSSPR